MNSRQPPSINPMGRDLCDVGCGKENCKKRRISQVDPTIIISRAIEGKRPCNDRSITIQIRSTRTETPTTSTANEKTSDKGEKDEMICNENDESYDGKGENENEEECVKESVCVVNDDDDDDDDNNESMQNSTNNVNEVSESAQDKTIRELRISNDNLNKLNDVVISRNIQLNEKYNKLCRILLVPKYRVELIRRIDGEVRVEDHTTE